VPLRLDNTKLRTLLGEEPHTTLDQAVEDTLAALNCLPTETQRGRVGCSSAPHPPVS